MDGDFLFFPLGLEGLLAIPLDGGDSLLVVDLVLAMKFEIC